MVFMAGVVFGSIMLVTGLLSLWISIPKTEDGRYDNDPSNRAVLVLISAIFVSLIGAGIVVLSVLE